MKRSPLIMATGGSGGHIYPAVATAKALEGLGYTPLFVGHARGMEAELIPKEGFAFRGVRAGKWDRSRPDPRQGVAALAGFGDAVAILRRARPAAVIGFGGFASFPALSAAALLRIPILLHEQNAFPGRVIRMFARRAALVALGNAAAQGHLEGAKTVYVGLPIREQRVERREARLALGLPEEGLVTLVMGGSQGATALNEGVPNAYAALSDEARRDLTVLHSTGPRWLEGVRRATEAYPAYRTEGWVDATLAWGAADLAITRAGMSTVAEAAFHGVPLVMVPLPSAAEDHQRLNAEEVERAGAGRVVLQKELERLPGVWRGLLEQNARVGASEAARKLSPAGAASRLAALIHETLSEHGKRKTQSLFPGASA